MFHRREQTFSNHESLQVSPCNSVYRWKSVHRIFQHVHTCCQILFDGEQDSQQRSLHCRFGHTWGNCMASLGSLLMYCSTSREQTDTPSHASLSCRSPLPSLYPCYYFLLCHFVMYAAFNLTTGNNLEVPEFPKGKNSTRKQINILLIRLKIPPVSYWKQQM